MRRAALLGDGWMPYLYSARRYADSVATIRRVARDAGRSRRGFGRYAFVFVNVDADGDRAREAAAQMLGGTYRQDFEAMIDRVAVAGTPAEVRTKLAEFLDAGARHLVIAPAAPRDTEPIVRRLLDDVLPAVAG